MVRLWREALVKRLLTRAPDTAAITWKRATLKSGQHRHTDVKTERIECAIADDVAWLAAHPTRDNNSEAALRRREFKEAMRRRISDIAASRHLSDEEIKPVLRLKHSELGEFAEKHGVSLQWLIEGRGPTYRGGRCELMDILDGE